MKRVELKRIAEILWKGTPADEKTPFAAQGTLPDNGSFSKNLDSEDIKKPGKEFSERADEKVEGPMSIPRKVCFVMSFNFWIIYFLALGWLIPCRNSECDSFYPDVVETNLSSIWLLTNVETVNVKRSQPLAIIGYSNGTELKLAAVETYNADFKWNNSLPFIPKKVQCNFGIAFDGNRDGIPDCLLSGFNDVYAFNATNGHVFWHQSIPSEEGNILSGFHPTMVRNGESFVFGTCGDKLVVLDGRNGTKVSEIFLPCESPFEIRMVSNVVNDNFTLWNLVCDYGDLIEAWSFGEEDVLTGGNLEEKANASDFELLFSGTNSGGSIDLGCDVTPIPGGPLLLSWSDRVVMVTQEATAWERHFPDPLAVASIKVGHFYDVGDLQIAAAVRNATNTIVYIMEKNNGVIVDSVMLKDRIAQSMGKISDYFDYLVLESLFFNYTSHPVYSNISDPIPTEQTNFALIDYSSGNFTIKDIATAGNVRGWAVHTETNGKSDLLVIKSENGLTTYQNYIIDVLNSRNSLKCAGSSNRHHYTFFSVFFFCFVHIVLLKFVFF